MSDFAPYIDLLTGAYQRPYFEALLAQAVKRAHQGKSWLSVVRIDIDDLQEHNDLHGEATLDSTLSWIATKVSALSDGGGPIGRVDGDEFALILEGQSLQDAAQLAEKIRRTIPRTVHSSAFGDYRVTVSVGVATLKASEPWGNLYDAAEAAVNRAKQGGRDTVVTR